MSWMTLLCFYENLIIFEIGNSLRNYFVIGSSVNGRLKNLHAISSPVTVSSVVDVIEER